MSNDADQLIDPELAENYRALLADKTRNLTPERLAAQAEAAGSTNLAAWARAQAAAAGTDVTPVDATSPTATTNRDAADSSPDRSSGTPDTANTTDDSASAGAAADAGSEGEAQGDDLESQLAPADTASTPGAEDSGQSAPAPTPAAPKSGKSSRR